MLTRSDWFTEVRSNRYHYATRFARHLPVIFVQPSLRESLFSYETTGIENLDILHIPDTYGPVQTAILKNALNERNIKRPLLWIYNFQFIDFIYTYDVPLKILHATEDYFSPEFLWIKEEDRRQLKQVLELIDLLAAVSPGVLTSYKVNGGYDNEAFLLLNGCDYKFYGPNDNELQNLLNPRTSPDKKVAFFQGNVNTRLDFTLMKDLFVQMPDWQFRFCGRLNYRVKDQLEHLENNYKNFKYYGQLPVEDVRALAYESTVGLIPYLQNEFIIERLLPLKAFEYAACGLPVVTVPISALGEYSDLFLSATNAGEFKAGIERAFSLRNNKKALKKRLEIAAAQDYDSRFDLLLDKIKNRPNIPVLSVPTDKISRQKSKKITERIKTLFLEQKATGKEWDHLSFILDWRDAFLHNHCLDLDVCNIENHHCLRQVLEQIHQYELIIISHSTTWYKPDDLTLLTDDLLKRRGKLAVFISNEYQWMKEKIEFLKHTHAEFVCTQLPMQFAVSHYSDCRDSVLLESPPALNPDIFLPRAYIRRTRDIGYIGEERLPWINPGDAILPRFVDYFRNNENTGSLVCDIRNRMINRDRWPRFLNSCKSVIGGQSGKSITSFHFEPVGAQTCQILLEDSFNGILKKDVHYIAVKKDLSNIHEALEKCRDESHRQRIINRTYEYIMDEHTYFHRVRSFLKKTLKTC